MLSKGPLFLSARLGSSGNKRGQGLRMLVQKHWAGWPESGGLKQDLIAQLDAGVGVRRLILIVVSVNGAPRSKR